MNYDLVRQIVEEETLKALASSRATPRLKRPVVSESMVVQAFRRGSRSIEITPDAIVTPAAADRATTLGLKIDRSMRLGRVPEQAAQVIESVMAAVVAQVSGHAPSLTPVMPGARRLITARHIEMIHLREKEVRLGAKDRITPLARDLAEKYGMRIVRG